MRQIVTMLRRPGVIVLTLLGLSDLAYRVLLRSSVRRNLGMRD